MFRDGKEEKNDEPFVFDVVTEAEAAMEVKKRRRSWRKSERLVLKNVIFGVRRYNLEDMKVEVMEFFSINGRGGGGGGGGEVGED